jgi:hypothetical protein
MLNKQKISNTWNNISFDATQTIGTMREIGFFNEFVIQIMIFKLEARCDLIQKTEKEEE